MQALAQAATRQCTTHYCSLVELLDVLNKQCNVQPLQYHAHHMVLQLAETSIVGRAVVAAAVAGLQLAVMWWW
eukprot:19069-Heterococcus_DN1.PRE.5